MKKILEYFAVIPFLVPLASAQTITLTLAPGTVVQSAPKQDGLNVGVPNYYDSGQYLNNLISGNSSFEANIFQQIWPLPYTANGSATVSGASVTATSGSFTGLTGNLDVAGTMCAISSVNSSTSITLSSSSCAPTGTQSWWGSDFSTSSFMDSGIYDPTPSGALVGATVTVIESQSAEQGAPSAKGCSSTTTSYTGANDTDGAIFVQGSACSVPYNFGDTVVVKYVRSPTPSGDWCAGNDTNGIWGACSNGGTLTSSSNTCGTSCGSQSIAMSGDASDSSATINVGWDTTTVNHFVLVSGPFTISFMYNCSSAPTLNVEAGRLSGSTWVNTNPTLTCDGNWHAADISGTGNDVYSTAMGNAQFNLSLTGVGAILVDNISLIMNQESQTTAFRDEVTNTWKSAWFNGSNSSSTNGQLRIWQGANGETFANWILPTAYKQNTSAGQGPYQGGYTDISLLDYLAEAEAIHGNPYIPIPVTFTLADTESLTNWLQANYGTIFSTIYLVPCNECWNTGATGQNLPPRAGQPESNDEYDLYDYSLWARDQIAAVRGSSGYIAQPSLFQIGYNFPDGGNAGVEAVGIARARPDFLEDNGYRQEEISGYTTDAELWGPTGSAMEDPEGFAYDPGNYNQFEQWAAYFSSPSTGAICGASGTAQCGLAVYEESISTSSGSIDQTHLDYATAGAGTGVTAANQYLKNLTIGIPVQNFFAANEYTNAGPQGPPQLASKMWGAYVDFGGSTSSLNSATFGGDYTPRPAALGIEVANKGVIGEMFSCAWTNQPTYDFAGSSTNGKAGSGAHAFDNVPYLDAYCFENGSGDYSIVFVNSSLTTGYTVDLAGLDTPTGTVNVAVFAPSGPDLLNEGTTASGSTNTVAATMSNTTSMLSAPTSVTVPALSVMTLNYSNSGAPVLAPLNLQGIILGPNLQVQ